jgi:hypothetical protein
MMETIVIPGPDTVYDCVPCGVRFTRHLGGESPAQWNAFVVRHQVGHGQPLEVQIVAEC